MAHSDERPPTYDFWSASARKAYDEMANRAQVAEDKLDKLRNKMQLGVSIDDDSHDTITWHIAVTSTLNKMLIEATATLDPAQIFDTVTRTLCNYLELTSVYICDYDPDNRTTTVLAEYISSTTSEKEHESDKGVAYHVDEVFEERLKGTGEHWINYPLSTPVNPYHQKHYEEYGVYTTVTVPMYFDGCLIGYIEGWDTKTERKFTEQQIEFLVMIASRIAGSVQMANLHHELSKREAQYRTLMDSIPGGVAQIDNQGKITYVNQHFASMINIEDSRQLINRNLDELWAALATATDYPDEYEMRDKDGTVSWIQVSEAPLPGFKGQPDGKAVIFSDITKRKTAASLELRASIERERASLLSEFIQTASHEFYTPLSVINTRVHMIKRQVADGKLLERLTSIEHQVGVLHDLVKSLATMTRLRTGDDFTLVKSNIVNLTQDIADSMQQRLASRQQQLIFSTQDYSIQCLCNPKILSQAIQRILDNAIRYTPDGGVIRIDIERQPASVRIMIADTGIGIDTASLDRVFDSFYRADKARTTRGFGLGLSIAKRAIELHDGQITIDSQEDNGTVITVDLPA